MDYIEFLKAHWERFGALIAACVGVVALALGWFGLSGKSLVTEQIPYLASGAVFGLFALGVSATLWLSAQLKDEWRKLDDIYQLLQGRGPSGNWAPEDQEVADLEPVKLEEGPARRRRRVARSAAVAPQR